MLRRLDDTWLAKLKPELTVLRTVFISFRWARLVRDIFIDVCLNVLLLILSNEDQKYLIS